MGTPEGERVGFSLQQIDGQWAVATSEISELRAGQDPVLERAITIVDEGR